MNSAIDRLVRVRRFALAALTVAVLGVPAYVTTTYAAANLTVLHDHMELDAVLVAPYSSENSSDARTFTLRFAYPTGEPLQIAHWQVQLRAPSGDVVQEWRGQSALHGGQADVPVMWGGRVGKYTSLPDGIYQINMKAFSTPLENNSRLSAYLVSLEESAAALDAEVTDQVWDIRVGNPVVPEMPAFAALRTNTSLAPFGAAGRGHAEHAALLSAPATNSLPYTVYYGNLHSQTNHSDGGGAIATCSSSQPAQTGQYGPADAFSYAKSAGLDFLMTSEHNHYFDGSSSTNASANPTTVHNLYQSGLGIASVFNTTNPDFLALYGMEWGVISNGGHLNILNSNELLGWEYNSSNQLLADTFTAKSDYAALYLLMKQRGWIGQFNHPASSGQFLVGGVPLGYSADGDEVMVLAEILNASAFSANTTETETGRSSFESAFTILLERGFHVAPTSNQDNHCANWGRSYTNRSAILLPVGAALNTTSVIEALRARRVFATMDKNSQLILTANGRMMGERFTNSGALSLTANFANTAGRTVSTVTIFQGVPGRNGTVTALASSASTTITPAPGKHFYYAKVTQDDGKILWSAPVWVEQVTSTDTTAPTVSTSASGSSGTITFAATASDNIGVTRVDFLVDGGVKGSATAAPYSLAFNSTTIADGSHTLSAKAYDAAGNVGTSIAVNFSVSNATGGGAFNEVESNGSVAAANNVARTYSAIVGTMGNTTDKDYFAVSLSANEKLTLGMTGPSTTDYDLYLVDASDVTLASSTAAASSESLTYTNGATAKTLYIKIISYSGSSTTLTYTVNITYAAAASPQLVSNGGFESGAASWTATAGVISNDATQAANSGAWKAWLNGYGSAHTDTLYQSLTIPATAGTVTFGFWLKVVSAETTTTQAYDTLKVQLRDTAGTVLTTLATYSNLNKGASYVQKSFDISSYKGQAARIYFEGVEGSITATSFLVDDVTIVAQ